VNLQVIVAKSPIALTDAISDSRHAKATPPKTRPPRNVSSKQQQLQLQLQHKFSTAAASARVLKRFRESVRYSTFCIDLSGRCLLLPSSWTLGSPPMGVPQSRNGKHKQTLAKILSDLSRLPHGKALLIPKAQLADHKGIRLELYRAAQKSGRKVSTSTDAKFLYVWNRSR
jgi:hypothetical protein